MAKEQKKKRKTIESIKEEIPELVLFAIEVKSLDNILGKTFPLTATVKVEYLGETLGESPPVNIQNADTNAAEFKTFLKVHGNSITLQHLDDITAHPIVFSVFYKIEADETPAKESKPSTVKSSQKASGKTLTTKTAQKEMLTLGSTNLDILPLLCGESMITESLLLEDSIKKSGTEITTWPNLPRLNACITKVYTGTGFHKPCNIVFITLGSLYNISPTLGNISDCEVVTLLPLFKGNEEILEDFGTVKFTDGVITSNPMEDEDTMRRWVSLATVSGRSSLSKYRLNTDPLVLKNTLPLTTSDLEDIVFGAHERLQWNLMRRCWLDANAQKEIYEKIVKYRCWPVELRFGTKNVGKEKMNLKSTGGSKGKSEAALEKNENVFVAYLDLSSLLYPGVTRTHITSQLYTYVAKDMKNKWGEEMFTSPSPPPPPSPPVSKKDKAPVTTKTKELPKSKVDTSKKTISPEQEEMDVIEEEAVALVTEEGAPIFITIEIELMHPLVKKKTEEELLGSVLEIVPEHKIPEPTIIAAQTVRSSFHECIESVIKYLNIQYQDFYSFDDQGEDDKDTRFLMHLHNTGAYSKMSVTIGQIMMDYIRDRIGLPPEDTPEHDIQTYISDLYVKLVEDMNIAVDFVIAGFELENSEKTDSVCTVADFNYFGVEAGEQGNPERAAQYFAKSLAHSKGAVPQQWLDFAIFHIAQIDYEKAAECAYQALSLDTRHKEGLLFYALLAWLREDLSVAELFFNALTEFHPRFYQAWLCFHMFYKHIDHIEGSEITYMCGMKSYEDLQNQTKSEGSGHKYHLLSWCSGFGESKRPFISTAIMLLKLGFPEFAQMCLARELVLQGHPTPTFLYYLAVCHYKQCQYEESLSHLEQALHAEWEDIRFWMLKGHNLYKLKREAETMEAYQFVLDLDCKGVPTDHHLLHLRMGQFLLHQNDFESAKKMFMMPCRSSPTPLVWFGLGMASYMLEQYEDAELSLNEANMLDPSVSEVWVLLAMVNMRRSRFQLAKKCENEAIRLGLSHSPLLEELTQLKASLNPCCP